LKIPEILVKIAHNVSAARIEKYASSLPAGSAAKVAKMAKIYRFVKKAKAGLDLKRRRI
jgi:hypothetical protein